MARSFDASIAWLEELYRRPFRPSSRVGLERVSFLMARLGDPHLAFRSVHITGSAGKGSTTTMVGSILREAGYSVGFFRSPHLESYTERVAIDEEDISPDHWTAAFNTVAPVAEAMQSGTISGYELGRPTLFEVLFAVASVHFASHGVAWATMEAGLGGRLDATNLLQSDVAMITNVSLEHTHVLGDTVRAIAKEKAAIIKPGAHAVTAADDPAALDVIERRARSVGAPLLRVGRDVTVDAETLGDTSPRVRVRAPGLDFETELGMRGHHQAINAAAAAAAALALRDRGLTIDVDAIRRGLRKARISGRYELVADNPPVILDGAHNPAGMQALASTLRADGRDHIVLIFSAMDDKDIESMARVISPLIACVIVTRVPNTKRGATVERMSAAFESSAIPARVVPEPPEALRQAIGMSGGRTIVVAGSLYLAGVVRRSLVGDAVT